MKIGETELKGREFHASGDDTHAETVHSDEFILEQGVVVLEVRHEGEGGFSLKIVPTEGWSETGSTIATAGAGLATSAATSAATGAAIGSILPGLGTLIGMGIGAVAGGIIGVNVGNKVEKFVGEKIDDEFRFAKWNHDGELDDYIVARVCDQDKTSDLLPGKHKFEVKAAGRWSVDLIQPEIGQASESIVDEIEDPFDDFVGEGHYVLPPMITGNKPVIAKAQHKGRAGFLVYATSVDGTHEVAIFRREGQFFEEGSSTDLIPGKEYILEIFADGEWNVSCSEGY